MKVAVIGQGGHSKVIQDMIRATRNLEIIGILDDKHQRLTQDNGIYIGPIHAVEQLMALAGGLVKFIIAIGDNKIRKVIEGRLAIPNDNYITLIHQTAVISPSVTIGHGSIIMANAIINADVQIGNHAIINTGAIIEHDSILEDFVHIAPNATLTGNVTTKEGAFVGAGATIIPGQYIGHWVTVGAGATVIHHLPPNCTAVGTPAKIIKKVEEEGAHGQHETA